ncbi:MAG: hypothetical protein QNJ47_21960 [Nostocaceae cyanobacterium]|nr:hypothetical protein [Nostocaceae cyanobacterium]
MKQIKSFTSACRYCRYYKPEGRRGGMCQQLGAPVQGNWAACSLALPPFAPSWEQLEEVWSLSNGETVVGSGLKQAPLKSAEETVTCIIAEQPKSQTVTI